MPFDNTFGNGQSNAAAAAIPRPGPIRPVEPVKDEGQVFRYDPDPRIPDLQ
jgi:hypothetical protein